MFAEETHIVTYRNIALHIRVEYGMRSRPVDIFWIPHSPPPHPMKL